MTMPYRSPSISELPREEQARALCLRLLTARSRTRVELDSQLTKRGYPDEVRARVLDRLAVVGLIDDSDFAEQWVRSRRMNAGKGKRVLAAELRAKGVDSVVIAAALADIDPADERDCAERLVRAKLRRGTLDDDTRIIGRLMAMLVRRGYGQALAYEVVSTELIAERERRRV
ncbi:MAG: recombination regulator RecX [Mycobacteriaceae bacterium]|nr:recombination regulator RecX [Mycobacteriaceae bacterium]